MNSLIPIVQVQVDFWDFFCPSSSPNCQYPAFGSIPAASRTRGAPQSFRRRLNRVAVLILSLLLPTARSLATSFPLRCFSVRRPAWQRRGTRYEITSASTQAGRLAAVTAPAYRRGFIACTRPRPASRPPNFRASAILGAARGKPPKREIAPANFACSFTIFVSAITRLEEVPAHRICPLTVLTTWCRAALIAVASSNGCIACFITAASASV